MRRFRRGERRSFRGIRSFSWCPVILSDFASVRQLFLNSDYRIPVAAQSLRPRMKLHLTLTFSFGDSMGEMSFYCALSDIALMGGSFLNYGCQNLIEPCSSGVPVIVGPSTF